MIACAAPFHILEIWPLVAGLPAAYYSLVALFRR